MSDLPHSFQICHNVKKMEYPSTRFEGTCATPFQILSLLSKKDEKICKRGQGSWKPQTTKPLHTSHRTTILQSKPFPTPLSPKESSYALLLLPTLHLLICLCPKITHFERSLRLLWEKLNWERKQSKPNKQARDKEKKRNNFKRTKQRVCISIHTHHTSVLFLFFMCLNLSFNFLSVISFSISSLTFFSLHFSFIVFLSFF